MNIIKRISSRLSPTVRKATAPAPMPRKDKHDVETEFRVPMPPTPGGYIKLCSVTILLSEISGYSEIKEPFSINGNYVDYHFDVYGKSGGRTTITYHPTRQDIKEATEKPVSIDGIKIRELTTALNQLKSKLNA